ncbi:ankyrin repeat domain-containing protein [Geomonas azotofigens]|uniref:ankyrin repeat domain-containing protein n=1 Tax=Geomonas azotofigens TaxID=2843196 RepID=UPI001C112BD4|nr:hypothetical protein [Geomonas azotofigens]MBU5613346.1 hypothetical protein [Geomonas azotofigens]
MSDIDYSEDFASPKEVELVKAIAAGDLNEIRRLSVSGVNLNCVGKYEDTPLRVAVKLKQKPVLKLLFELGVDPNSKTSKGTVAAADDAVMEKNPEYLKCFLDFGLDPNLKTNDGVSLIFIAVSRENWPQYDMLLAHGANINSKLPDGSSLLLDLVMQMEYDRAKDLLLKGADFRGKSMHGFTVLGELIDYQRRFCSDPGLPDCRKRAELLQLLQQRGASVPAGLPCM